MEKKKPATWDAAGVVFYGARVEKDNASVK